MGVVYRARDRQLDEVVALKLLRPEALASDPTLLDRFKQEIKLARRITHQERAAHPRLRGDGRGPLHLDGVSRGRDAQGPREEPRCFAARRGPRGREADVPRARGRARDRRRAPRHQAAEHADRARDRRAQDHGLRHLAAHRGRPRHLRPHLGRHRDGDARLHAARAGAGQGRRLPLRHLLARRGVLRDLHGQAAVQGRDPDGGGGGAHPTASAFAPAASTRSCRRSSRR